MYTIAYCLLVTVHVLYRTQWYANPIINSLLLQRHFIVSRTSLIYMWGITHSICALYSLRTIHEMNRDPRLVYIHALKMYLLEKAIKERLRHQIMLHHWKSSTKFRMKFRSVNRNLFGTFTDNNNNKKAHHRNKIHLKIYV